MSRPETLLGGLSVEDFLALHWQKAPLLVRGALPDFRSPLTPEELAGWACEEHVGSRLILETGSDPPWELRQGPFETADFEGLPERRWTLLVQEMDRHLPAVADLLAGFDFLPNWRFDDVMVSYAAPEGSVGAHVDRYDVFLLQGLGRRRWRIAHRPPAAARTIPGLDVRILEHFEPDAEWDLGPGDMLYLPPGLPHHGVALEPAMTFSIGFRAPAAADLAAALLEEVVQTQAAGRLYSDPDLAPAREPGRIDDAALERVRGTLGELLADRERLRAAFGRLVTLPRHEPHEEPLEPAYDPRELVREIRDGAHLRRSSRARFAWADRGPGRVLFAGGEAYELGRAEVALASLLAESPVLDASTLAPWLRSARLRAILTEVVNRGYLIVENADGDE